MKKPVFFLVFLLPFLPSPPQGRVRLSPGQDLQAAVDAHPAGTIFTLTPGLYRLQSVNPKTGDTFIGESGAIMSGASLLTSFTRKTVSGVTYWVAPGPTTPGQQLGECNATNPVCTYPEDFYINDKPLARVVALANVTLGKCFFSYSAGKIYFLDNPTGHKVEVSQTRNAFGPPPGARLAPNVTIRGLVIEKYASPGDVGAVGDQYGGNSWTIANNEIRLNHGAGVLATTNNVITGNFIHDNGNLGITGTSGTPTKLAPGVDIENNEVSGNNYAGFGYGWSSGGIKISYAQNLTVRNNYVHDNNGPGLWTDTANRGTLYENNRVVANMGVGIWHEVSYDVTIRYNFLIRNGLLGHPWLYASQILIANSQSAQVYNNVAVVDGKPGTTGRPANGITILQADRSADGPSYYTIHNSIHHNVVTYLGNVGQSGAGADTLPGQPYDPRNMYNGNNLFDYNIYHVPLGTGSKRWNWKCATGWDCWLDWAAFRAQGQEAHGVVDTNLIPLNSPAPSVPTGLVANALGPAQVKLTWNPSTGRPAGYRIFRNNTPRAMTLNTSFVDTGLNPGTSYTYAVASYNEVGTISSQSAGVTARTAAGSARDPRSDRKWSSPHQEKIWENSKGWPVHCQKLIERPAHPGVETRPEMAVLSDKSVCSAEEKPSLLSRFSHQVRLLPVEQLLRRGPSVARERPDAQGLRGQQ